MDETISDEGINDGKRRFIDYKSICLHFHGHSSTHFEHIGFVFMYTASATSWSEWWTYEGISGEFRILKNTNNNKSLILRHWSAREAGAAAELAASRKEENYANIGGQY